MNKAVVGAGAVVLAAAGAAGWMQHQDKDALRREVELLRSEVQSVGRAMERMRTTESMVEVSSTPAAPGTSGRG